MRARSGHHWLLLTEEPADSIVLHGGGGCEKPRATKHSKHPTRLVPKQLQVEVNS